MSDALRMTLRHFGRSLSFRHWERTAGALVLAGWLATALSATWLAPSVGLGMAQWLLATRVVLLQVVSVVLLSLPVGALLGVTSALGPKPLDSALMRAVELAGALPGLIIVGLWRVGSDSPTMPGFIAIVSVLKAIEVARLVSEHTTAERQREHVAAARALGTRPGRIFRVHVLPRLYPPLVIEAGTIAAYTVGLEAAASFINLGPRDVTTWGSLLGQAARGGDIPDSLVWACLFSLTATTLALHALASRPRPVPSNNKAFQPSKSD